MTAVDCWCVRLDVSPGDLGSTLTGDERERCARFRFARDRRRFVVAHGVLRRLLGRYLGVRPEGLRFERNEFGKPRLSPRFDRRLRFNLSHSADVALIAVAVDAEVGVDVEYIRALPDLADDPRAFLGDWTRKEAYVKARGESLARLSPTGDIVPDQRWSLYGLHPAPGYIGAVAIKGRCWRLSQLHW